jgi:hypothetical protein
MDIVLGLFVAIIILAALSLSLFLLEKAADTKHTKEAVAYLNAQEEKIYDSIVNIIDHSESKAKDLSRTDFMYAILHDIHIDITDIIFNQISKDTKNHDLTKGARLKLDSARIHSYIDSLIDRYCIRERIDVAWVSVNYDFDKMQKENDALEDKFSDSSLYYENFDDDKDTLEPADITPVESEEDPDDVEYSDDDDTVEEIGEDGLTDSERDAGVHFDKKGRKRAKNGRFV